MHVPFEMFIDWSISFWTFKNRKSAFLLKPLTFIFEIILLGSLNCTYICVEICCIFRCDFLHKTTLHVVIKYRYWAGEPFMCCWPLNMLNSKLDMISMGGFGFIHDQGPPIPKRIFLLNVFLCNCQIWATLIHFRCQWNQSVCYLLYMPFCKTYILWLVWTSLATLYMCRYRYNW